MPYNFLSKEFIFALKFIKWTRAITLKCLKCSKQLKLENFSDFVLISHINPIYYAEFRKGKKWSDFSQI